MGPVEEQQVRINLYAETIDRIASRPWKYKMFDHTGLHFCWEIKSQALFLFSGANVSCIVIALGSSVEVAA